MVNLNGINVGLTICYDIRFPEIFREYRKNGADLLVNMAAWGSKKPIPWETLTRARAIENQAYMIALTQSGQINENEWNIGHSRIFDYVGETVAEIKDQKEGIMSCEINFSSMYDYRKTCTVMKDICDNYEVNII
jgi:predicted amidohydrolase